MKLLLRRFIRHFIVSHFYCKVDCICFYFFALPFQGVQFTKINFGQNFSPAFLNRDAPPRSK